MALKALIFGSEDAQTKIKPFCDSATKRGDFEIAARATVDGDTVNLFYANGERGGGC